MAKMTGRKKQDYCKRGHLLADTRVMNNSDGFSRCSLCRNIRQKEYSDRKGGKEFIRNQNLKNKYKIDSKSWDELFSRQDYSCAICKTKETKKWHTDHCHKTGVVRGVLCAKCNSNLGGFEALLPLLYIVKNYLGDKK